ncbi:MAG TPA: PTS glucose transporter subunit IIA [Candidatus Olsenella stercoravium]|uniref:PTS glucose transporter subunit IIA n=1 Tax=Candidatus Olsenella stercoravium TaxID=2838713 RepID=A0A9D2DLH3_9ACTN|nr:PTS glucose transporter subunit IIA [Candidatus Olsenella stercoravium]
MAIFDKLTKKDAPVEVPESLQIDAQPGIGYAPVSGRVIRMTDVPDKIFSTEVLGKGCALWPDGDVIYAPANGWVGTAMGHAVTIKSDGGAEVLIHVGVNTVNLKGKGFTNLVSDGERVVAGQPIIVMDRKVISEAGYQDCVVFAISNSADLADVELTADFSEKVDAGAPILKVTF